LWVCVILTSLGEGVRAKKTSDRSRSQHTNNWAVLVDTSRFWFNYRHSANALTMYRTVKRLGIPDSHIILMLADDVACNARNSYPGQVFNNANHKLNLYGDTIEVDYRGPDVSVESFLRVLQNRHEAQVPRSKRLLSDRGSNILIFMTGHGGEEFLKFQDAEEILSRDIADAIAQMHIKGRYNEILFVADTCQAESLFKDLYTPGVIGLASSVTGQSSYSHSVDFDVGVSVIDRFSMHTVEFFESINITSEASLAQLFAHYTFEKLHSTAVLYTDLFTRAPMDEVLLTDFFGSVMKVELMEDGYPGFQGKLADLGSNNQTIEHGFKAHSKIERNSAFEDSLAEENAKVLDGWYLLLKRGNHEVSASLFNDTLLSAIVLLSLMGIALGVRYDIAVFSTSQD